MVGFGRTDNSLLTRWWWTVDRWLLVMVATLAVFGFFLSLTASPAIAERLHLDTLHFAKRQAVFLTMGLGVILFISVLPVQMVRRIALIGFPVSLLLIIATLLVGPEIKGATRWLQIGSFTLQPSEFMKPFFVVTIAWVLSANFEDATMPGKKVAFGLFALVIGLLILQPDFGQSVLISAVWMAQMALAGLPFMWMALAGAVGVLGLALGYVLLPHVANRIDRFINPASGDTYQIDKAMQAFENGGLLGVGPGDGTVKKLLPDAHTDFIFAVIGEEFGAVACVMLLLLFTGVVMRGLSHLLKEEDPFKMMAAGGLIMQFGLQCLINVGVNLAVLPSKGMTLPFISYGGSSMLALCITVGMILALTRCNRYIKPGMDPVGWKAAE